MSLRRVSAGSGANGHTAVGALRGRTPGERGWFDRNCPHRARSLLGDRKLEEPSRELPTGLGIDPRDRMPTTTSSKSIRGSSTIAKSRGESRSFCRPRPNPIWVPKHCYQDAPWRGLIAEFYLVDRGLRHRLPGFSFVSGHPRGNSRLLQLEWW